MADSQLMPLLVAQAWQITLLIVAVAVLNRWLGKLRPHLAHALWVVVLVKCVTPPLWSSPSGIFCWLQPSREEAQQRSVVVVQNSREASPETECLTEWGQVFKFHFWDHERHQTWTGTQTPDVQPSPFVAPKMKFEDLTSARDESVAEVRPSRVATAAGLPNVLFGLWVLVSLGVIGVAIGRWFRCWRMVRTAPQRNCSELSAEVESLAKRLRLRRRVRLIVTENRIGPAVIGLFRTTVLLPALIVDRLAQRSPFALREECRTSLDSESVAASERQACSAHPAERDGDFVGHVNSPLTAILAHELLHVRRGDLWVGLLQTLSQAVWWCHPLVWWVNRLTTREAERCCDEEVLAELGCDPATYARALVDVLELKRELKPVPVFPGVRPVEVTSQRLERIMQLGQGCRRRTPWWCWLIAALAAAASWPGAAFVVTAEDPGERGGVSPPVTSPQPLNQEAGATPLVNARATQDGTIKQTLEPLTALAYEVIVISGTEAEIQQLAKQINGKLMTKISAPIVVEHEVMQRLLKEAQAAPRVNLVSHRADSRQVGERASVGDTRDIIVPAVVTSPNEPAQFIDTSREYGWTLAMEPVAVRSDALRLRVVHWQGQRDHNEKVKARHPKSGEGDDVPGITERQTDTAVELRDGQSLVFPVSKVPLASSKDFMLLTLQVRRTQPPSPAVKAEQPIAGGVGVNSDSGLTGEVVPEPTNRASTSMEIETKLELPKVSDKKFDLVHNSWTVSVECEKGFAVEVPNEPSRPMFSAKGPVEFVIDYRRNVRLRAKANQFIMQTDDDGHVLTLRGAVTITTESANQELTLTGDRCSIMLPQKGHGSSTNELSLPMALTSSVKVSGKHLFQRITFYADDVEFLLTAQELKIYDVTAQTNALFEIISENETAKPSVVSREPNQSTADLDDDDSIPSDNITEIRVEGNRLVSTDEVLAMIKSKPGTPVNEKQIRADVRGIYASRRFFAVEPKFARSEKGLTLVLQVVERPMVEQGESTKKLQLDSLGQLLWQHHSWFVVVRPEPGQKLIDSGESPGKFHSDGPVRLMLTKMVDGFSNKHQIRISADEFNLWSDEKGLGRWIRLGGHVRLAGHGFQVESDLMELSLGHKLTSWGHEKELGAMLRGHILLRKNTNGEPTVLRADQAILTLRGSALAGFLNEENGPVAVLWDPPAEDKMLSPRAQVVRAHDNAEKRISVHFEKAPLKRVLEHLGNESDRTIQLDNAGLEDEGLTLTEFVTLNLDEVTLQTALTLLLDPLNLGYRVEESGVIAITSQQRLKRLAVAVTYSVADLAVPLPKRVVIKIAPNDGAVSDTSKPDDKLRSATPVRTHGILLGDDNPLSKDPKALSLRFQELIELITTTCQPNSWASVGGGGNIKGNDSTLSLVVRQTPDVHAEIRDLLEQLRRLQDVSTILHVDLLTVPGDFWQQVGKGFDVPSADVLPNPQPKSPDNSAPRGIARLSKKEAALLRSLSRPLIAPKLTLFNGQEAELLFGGEPAEMRLALKPVVSADRKSLRLQAVAAKPDAALDLAKSPGITFEDGQSLVLDVTDVDPQRAGGTGVPMLSKVPNVERLFKNTGEPARRTLLLITGIVVVAEQEEVRYPAIGVPK